MNIPGAFTNVDVFFKNKTEKALLLEQEAGFQVALLGPRNATVNEPTGLANDATAYTATVVIDGSSKSISVVGSAAQTFGTLITEINADLTTSGTATLTASGITITSATKGPTSSVAITDGTLFAALVNWFQKLLPAVPGKNVYLRYDAMDGNSQVYVTGIMNAVDSTATPWTSGVGSISLTPISPAVTVTQQTETGLDPATTYSLQVAVDGASAVTITFSGKKAFTFQNLIDDAITPALVAANVPAVASFDAGATGYIRIKSKTTGTSSTVTLTDGVTNGVVAALSAFSAAILPSSTSATAGYQVVNIGGAATGSQATGLANDTTAYTATITVDGSAKAISVVGSAAQTITTLISEINTDLGASATAALNGGNIRVTSATTGATSTIAIVDSGANHLFATLTGYVGINAAVPGVAATSTAGTNGSSTLTFPVTYQGVSYADWMQVLSLVKGPTGFGPLFTSLTVAIADKGPKPAAKGDAVETFVYYNGTNWVYFINDAAIGETGTTVNPPGI